MATLRANGTELVRLEKVLALSEGLKCLETHTLMSSGWILQKSKFIRPDGSHRSTGYTRHGKIKADRTQDQWLASKMKQGWVRV